jgi:hypothetical protein
MLSITDLIKSAGTVSAITLALCLTAGPVSAKSKEAKVRIVAKHLVVHPNVVPRQSTAPRSSAPAGNPDGIKTSRR